MTHERFRALLLEERERASKAVEFLRREHAESMSDELGEPGLDQHPADAATETVEREIDLTLEESEAHLLAEVEAALGRIEDGSYGSCPRCKQPIPEARLEALPHARYCIDCQRQEERG